MAQDLRILVVDDEDDVREAMATLLEAFLDKPRIRQASSGGEGLRLLRNEGADLILADFKMPGMDGARFLDAARKLAPDASHIVVTAFDHEAIRGLGASGKGTPIVHKPFDPGQLLQVVDATLSGPRGAAVAGG